MRIPAPLSAWTVLALSVGPSSVKISGPKPAIQGEGNDYVCSAECIPPCTYSWFVDGDDLNMHRTKLTVIAGQRKPFTLECTALNPESGEIRIHGIETQDSSVPRVQCGAAGPPGLVEEETQSQSGE
ncbi:hypothetical protein JZ751_028602, partial [Albula glossodonta]